ncbi:MAG: DUF58 domain-containing protein [Planctomycetota bacterium]
MNKSRKYFDPETLATIRPLGLRAKTLIEGLVGGLHRSPQKGHSIEFAQHREYVPGDDVRQVDWKVYARSDRYYLKQYEDETNLVCYLLVDHSESMEFRGQQSSLNKLEYAQLIACSLAYLVTAQQDSAGLVTFSEKIDHWLPASSSSNLFEDFVSVLEQSSLSKRTDVSNVLSTVTQRLTRPSLIILLSDLFGNDDNGDALMDAIRLLRCAGHDFMALHILDSEEIDFPFDQVTDFEGLEVAGSIQTNPALIATAYREALETFCQSVRVCCQQQNADYFRVRTDQTLLSSLPEILASRRIGGR